MLFEEKLVKGNQVDKLIEDFEQYLKERGKSERTITVYMSFLKNFCANYSVTFNNMKKCLNKQIDKKLSKTYSKSVFYNLLKMLGKHEMYEYLPVIKIPERVYEGTHIDIKTANQLINNIKDDAWKMVALIQYETGLRSHEVIHIRRQDIKAKTGEDGKPDIIIYTQTKGGKKRAVYITRNTQDLLFNYLLRTKDSHYEFPFMRGTTSKGFTTWVDNNTRYYRKALRKAVELTNRIERFTTHDFRRTFIRDVHKKHKDIVLAKNLVGHKSLATTVKYFPEGVEDQKNIIRGLRK